MGGMLVGPQVWPGGHNLKPPKAAFGHTIDPMNTPSHVFLEQEFLALVTFSLILPVAIYWFLFKRASISRFAVMGFAAVLIVMAGIDVYLLQALADLSRSTPNTLDDRLFLSGISIALYLLPAVFAGIGINLLSHILIDHLHRAEARHDREERSGR